jgi:hypothetical protein
MVSYACPVNDTTWGHTSYPELQPSQISPQVVYHQTTPLLYPSSAPSPLLPISAVVPPSAEAPRQKWTFIQQDTALVILFLAILGLTLFVFHVNSRIATLSHMMQYLIMHGMAKNTM